MTETETKSIPELMNLLFSTYPARPVEEGADPARQMAAQLEAYERALTGMDLRDIDEAVTRFLQGRVPGINPAFLPSAAVVGSVVRQCMNDRLDSEARDRARRPRLPPPEIERTPESIQRMQGMVSEVVSTLAAHSLTEDAARERRRRQLQDDTDARFALDMSPEAQRKRLMRRQWYGIGDPEGAMD